MYDKIHYNIKNLKKERKKEKNQTLPLEATWMDSEDIMLSEVSRTERGRYCVISLVCGT